MDFWNGIPVIDDSTPNDVVFDPANGRGCVPRDFAVQPREMFASADMIPLVGRSEWEPRIKEEDREESSIWHNIIRGRAAGKFTDLYQGQYGFCWGHSTAHAVATKRLLMNQTPVALSAFGLVHLADAQRAQNNRGGWCGLSAQAAREKGIPSQTVYPQGRVLPSITQTILDDAKNQIVTEDFVDLEQPVWFQNLPFDAVASCLLTKRPCALDFNWWGHSVMGARLVLIEAGSFGILILNSWGLSWGQAGFSVLRGSRATPNGAIAVNSVKVSAEPVRAEPQTAA